MKSKKLLLPVMLAACLAGCASTTSRLPERVLVPVATACPVPDVPVQPVSPPSLHVKNQPDSEKARAIALYFEQIYGQTGALESLLDGYATPKAATK